ncbi:peptidoglycan editing factor PgeF [Mastigocoleus testarum]|uniref:Purine nucleoside phosphorylase n=1 Tax=Mastigocoleus testarum BC008 TaxID=371196 RepID=A0A0V7ZPC3_9CYAN|nr:peptidoglycan editing factor PgeF [Mastigocoleus testarum]KST66544.1 laccase [Mastigocoleus testarum BC008]
MHTWHWRDWEGLPYLTCSLLEPIAAHGFLTQHFWSRPLSEMTKALTPGTSVYRLKQVHGNTVLSPTEIEHRLKTGKEIDEQANTVLAMGDGLLSDNSQQALWVASADCTPVLIADQKTGQVAAAHAGWRGTAQKIVPQAIARMQEKGSKISDLRIAMGPAIAGEVYQVSLDVAARVGASIAPLSLESQVSGSQKILSQEQESAIVRAVQKIPNSPLLPDPEAGKIRLDVRRVNALQMEQLGIGTEQIAIAPYCTYQTPKHFFSYRRAKEKKVQWSGIISP